MSLPPPLRPSRTVILTVVTFVGALTGFPPAVVIWWLGNLILTLTAVGWGIFHLGAVLKGRDVALRWAFWVSLAVIFALWSLAEVELRQVTGDFVLPEGISGLIALTFFPLSLIVLLGGGFAGSALGAFLQRDDARRQRPGARTGVRAFWFAVAGLAFLTILLRALPPAKHTDVWITILWSGLPLATVALCLLADDPERAPQRHVLRWVEAGLLRLVWRTRVREKMRTVDTRGAALGAAAGLAAVCLVLPGGLAPLQTTVLVTLLRFRSALQWIPLGPGPFEDVSAAGGALPGSGDGLPGDIVLLELDSQTRHHILTTGSEAAVQAEVVRRLKRWGAAAVVLPFPVLDGRRDRIRWHAPDQPLPDPPEVGRTLRDLPRLAAAVRQAGNVFLALPAERAEFRELEPVLDLLSGARGAGSAELPVFLARRLPVIPLDVPGATPPPGARRNLLRTLEPVGRGTGGSGPPDRRQSLAPGPRSFRNRVVVPATGSVITRLAGMLEGTGEPPAEVAPGRVLVGYVPRAPGGAFRRTPYADVLHSEAMYAGGEGPSHPLHGRQDAPDNLLWLPPHLFWRGKVVFLDSLVPAMRDTPLGPMPRNELLAHATTTLAGGRGLRPLPTLLAALAALAAGLLSGQFCLRRDPLDSVWRVALLLLVFALGSLFALSRQVWLDPVTPSVAAIGAMILVTQFSFQAEREERERNRTLLGRFVAPQILDELLDDPARKLGLGGEQQEVCVLFADARSYSPYVESHTPEEVVAVTNAYLTALTDALFAHRGILDKYLGDGLMAFFRVPEGEPCDAVARTAVEAALHMRDAALQVSADLVAQGRDPLGIGIGVHLGTAVVGLIGNPARWDYTALGHAVVVGHRLQGTARAGEVVVSDSVHRSLEGAFCVEEREPVTVKGLSEPVRSFLILDAAGQ